MVRKNLDGRGFQLGVLNELIRSQIVFYKHSVVKVALIMSSTFCNAIIMFNMGDGGRSPSLFDSSEL